MRRCLGIERLEGRTVFASDLGVDLEEPLFACTATEFQTADVNPASESQARSESNQGDQALSTGLLSEPNDSSEVASSVVSFANGDLLTIEVLAGAFEDLPDNDSYVLTYTYAQNYFLDGAAGAGRVITRSEWSDDPGSAADATSMEPVQTPSDNQSQAQSLVLASLTATTDFVGTIRLFDNSQIDSRINSGQYVSELERLPSEIRIEPNVTGATVLRDPGPTITRTIVVNRQSEGLVLQDEPSKLLEPTQQPESKDPLASVSSVVEASTPTSASTSVTKPSRPATTIKTIDISQVRRHEVARPWLRSSVIILNPTRQRDFGFEKKPPVVQPSATSGLPTQPSNASKLDRSAKWNSRVSATRLQPVEFLLAANDLEYEKAAETEGKPLIATDVAMSRYSATSSVDGLELANEVLPDWLGAIAVDIKVEPSSSLETDSHRHSQSHDSKAWLMAMVSSMQRLAQYPRSNTNRDSWKSLVRSASETAVGQVFLATMSTIAAQQKEMNSVDTKSAWEFVTRPMPGGQV